MDQSILEKAKAWVENEYIDQSSKNEIQEFIDTHDEKELVARFYEKLEFGTAGIRGKMGAGLSRYNIYLVRQVTQGLANYLLKQFNLPTPLRAAIGYDNRHGSIQFAQETASILAASGIQVHIYPELCPTPMLAFAVRQLKASIGVMITASHNPPEYNGYKVFWSDGCQIIAPHDQGIMDCIDAISDFSQIRKTPYEDALKSGKIQLISNEINQAFYREIEKLCLGDRHHNKTLKALYTPLHGTGSKPVMEVFKRRGFDQIRIVEEQALPDADFSTVKSPNPENPDAFEYAKKVATDEDQLLLASDPDTDRLGVMIKDNNQWVTITGNQIGQLLLEYYLEKLKETEKLPSAEGRPNGYVVSTIVTSELTQKIAEHYGLKYYNTLTGFKNIGKIIADQEKSGKGVFIFGMEEANGYLIRDFIRDKDGVGAVLVFAEMAAELASKGKSVADYLEMIYQKYGYHDDSQVNFELTGVEGTKRISEIMQTLRTTPPHQLGNTKIIKIYDYEKDEITDLVNNKKLGSTGIENSNVLAFYLEDGSRITIRPSGTEPKIKLYFNLCESAPSHLEETRQFYQATFTNLIQDL